MAPLTCVEDENRIAITYGTLYDGLQSIEAVLTNSLITITKKGVKIKTVDTRQIKQIIYSAEQRPMRNAYASSLKVTGEIYFPVEGYDYAEIVTISTVEPASLTLRETQTFKVTELLATKFSNYYNIDAKFQYEIVSKKKGSAIYWMLAIFGLMWLFLFLLIFISNGH